MKRTSSLAIAAAVAFCSLIALVPDAGLGRSRRLPDQPDPLAGGGGDFASWALDGTTLTRPGDSGSTRLRPRPAPIPSGPAVTWAAPSTTAAASWWARRPAR